MLRNLNHRNNEGLIIKYTFVFLPSIEAISYLVGGPTFEIRSGESVGYWKPVLLLQRIHYKVG